MRRRWAPEPGAQIDGEHPLAQRLVCLVPGWQIPVTDLITGRAFSNRGAPTWGATDIGSGVDMASSSQKGCYLDISASSDPLKLQPPLTIAWLGNQVGAPHQFGHLWGATYSNNDTSPYAGWALSRADPAGTYQIAFNSAGTLVTLAGTTSCDSTRGLVMVTATVSSAGYTIWVRGARENSSATAVTTINYTTPELLLGTWSSVTSRGFNVNHVMGYAWNRVLTDQEIVELWEDPFPMFVDLQRSYQYVNVTGTIASAVTATATGTAVFDAGSQTSITIEALDAVTGIGSALGVSKGANNDTPPVGVGAAYNATVTSPNVHPDAATATVTTAAAAPSVGVNAGLVVTALANTATVTATADSATSSGAGSTSSTGSVAPNAVAAGGAGAAPNPSVSTSAGTNVNPGTATASGVSNSVTATVATPAVIPSAAGAANAAQSSVAASAEVTVGAGVAYQPAHAAPATVAAASSAAHAVTPTLGLSAGVIPVAVSVNNAAISTTVTAGSATAAGAALQSNQSTDPGQTVTVRDRGHTISARER